MSQHRARVYLQFEAARSYYDESRVVSVKPIRMTRKRPADKAGIVIVAVDVTISDTAFVGYAASLEIS